jgi:hypothetical protein
VQTNVKQIIKLHIIISESKTRAHLMFRYIIRISFKNYFYLIGGILLKVMPVMKIVMKVTAISVKKRAEVNLL